jgi:hypothetical protein
MLAWGFNYPARTAMQLVVCLFGLALVSEAIRATIRPDRLAARVRQSVTARGALPAPATSGVPS